MLVHFWETKDTATGTRAPIVGLLRFRATLARVIAGTPDEEVLPVPFSVALKKNADGKASVTLPATGLSWAWEVNLYVEDGPGWGPVYVTVPEGVECDWPDLVRVDPATLDPAAAPEAAWWAALEGITDDIGVAVADYLVANPPSVGGLDSLTDVDTTGQADGDVLLRSGGVWGPATPPVGPVGPTAVSTDPNNAATLGTDDLIYVPESIRRGPGASGPSPYVNINGRGGPTSPASTDGRVISHYNPETFTCDAIALIQRSGDVGATYRLSIWSGYPNPSLVFTTPEFSVPTAGEATPAFTVPSGTVFPRGVWYIALVLTSGTSGTFGSGVRDAVFEPNRDVNASGTIEASNFGVVGPGWVPPAALTLSTSWGGRALPQLLAKNVRFV